MTAANQPPTVPGAPALAAGSTTPNRGVFTLTWAASTDPQGDPIIYRLEHKDANDTDYSVVAPALTSATYNLPTGSPEAEGTWTYRVLASDGSLTSILSAASAAIKIDRTPPSAPTASVPPPTYAGNGGWYNDSVTVTFGGSQDPPLADGSPGSGVASVTPPVTRSTSGTHQVSGTASDAAGNASAPTTLSVQVDATTPAVTLTCPLPVVLGSTSSASWNAADGESGLATPASGALALDTSTVGQDKTATLAAGAARDQVGHMSAAATCTYDVVYASSGSYQGQPTRTALQPINSDGSSVFKQGSTIKVQFRVLDATGASVKTPVVSEFKLIQVIDGTVTTELTEPADSTTPFNEFRWDEASQQWVFNLSTKNLVAGKTYVYHITLNDGTFIEFRFGLR